MAMADRLIELYWELQTDEQPIGLEEFLNRAVAGDYGSVSREELHGFLREVETRLCDRIERGEGTAHDGAARDDLVDETHAWIEDLVSKFCDA